MPEHLSRKELKQDKIHDVIEHSAEAVFSHSQAAAILVSVVIAIVLVYGGWKLYSDRQTLHASAALDEAMKVYNAPIRQANVPLEASEISYTDSQLRAQDAKTKFTPGPGRNYNTQPQRMGPHHPGLHICPPQHI